MVRVSIFTRLLMALIGVGAYGLSLERLSTQGRTEAPPELLVSLPRFAQILLAAGDTHLAANLDGFRVLVAATARMGPDDFAVQARLQQDIAWFNPGHEDNYYIAAAFLPWNGQLEAAQMVLRAAADARPLDWQPLFYLGFHHYHFLKDPAQGARWLLEAVPRAEEQQDRWALQNLAAIWLEKGYSTATAAEMVGAMAVSAPQGNFRKYLQVRAERLRTLAQLRNLAIEYRKREGRPLAHIETLVDAGMIAAIPEDPLGAGYVLDGDGLPSFGKIRRER